MGIINGCQSCSSIQRVQHSVLLSQYGPHVINSLKTRADGNNKCNHKWRFLLLKQLVFIHCVTNMILGVDNQFEHRRVNVGYACGRPVRFGLVGGQWDLVSGRVGSVVVYRKLYKPKESWKVKWLPDRQSKHTQVLTLNNCFTFVVGCQVIWSHYPHYKTFLNRPCWQLQTDWWEF